MLQAYELTKRYGGLLALDRVSFELRPGEIVGYLGPNGSGKSTTVNLVVGLLEPSEGDVSLCGIRASDDPIAYKRRIGYVPEELSFARTSRQLFGSTLKRNQAPPTFREYLSVPRYNEVSDK